jgi:hypothetical protein
MLSFVRAVVIGILTYPEPYPPHVRYNNNATGRSLNFIYYPIYLFYLTSALQHRTMGWLMNNELKRMRKETLAVI